MSCRHNNQHQQAVTPRSRLLSHSHEASIAHNTFWHKLSANNIALLTGPQQHNLWKFSVTGQNDKMLEFNVRLVLEFNSQLKSKTCSS